KLNKKENNKESGDKSTKDKKKSKIKISKEEEKYEEEKELIRNTKYKCILKEGIEIRWTYLGEKKSEQVKKYYLSKIIPEQQGWIKQILLKYNNIFAKVLDQLERMSIV
ncbi:22458_t:CDS:2, partial [Gigaspora margarita]